MLDFLTFGMDIDDDSVFVQKNCDLVALFKGLISMCSHPIFIYLIGSPFGRLYREPARCFRHDAADSFMTVSLFTCCETGCRIREDRSQQDRKEIDGSRIHVSLLMLPSCLKDYRLASPSSKKDAMGADSP